MHDETKYWDRIQGRMGAEYHLYFMPYYDYELLASITLDHGGYPCVTSSLLRMTEEPLTLEQVKQRKWVWIDGDTDLRNRGWAKVHAMYGLAKLEAVGYSFAKYRKTWIAYAREPEHAPLEGADK